MVVEYSSYKGVVIVGGVLLDHFIKDPGFQLRDPQRLLDELLRCFCSVTQDILSRVLGTRAPAILNDDRGWTDGGVPQDRLLIGVVSACLSLLRVRPGLAVYVGTGGHIKTLCQILLDSVGGDEELAIDYK